MNLRVLISTLSAAALLSGANPATAQFAACSFTNSPLSGVGTDPVTFVRMALRTNGLAVLAYTTKQSDNSSTLYFYNCADSTCSTGQAKLLDVSTNFYGAPGIVIRPNGRPAISATYFAGVRYYDCLDSGCVSINATDLRPGTDAIFSAVPLTLQPNGNPVLAYMNGVTSARPYDLKAYVCADTACATGSEETLVAADAGTSPVVLQMGLASGSDGLLASSYLLNSGLNSTGGQIQPVYYELARCNDLACSAAKSAQLSAPTATSSPNRTAVLVRSDQRPLALDSQSGNTALLDCADSACLTFTNRLLPASAAGTPIGLGSLPGDVPAFAVFNSGSVAAYACADATCSSGAALSTTNSTATIVDADFAIDVNLHPAIAYIDATSASLSLAACYSDEIFVGTFE